MEEIKKLYNAIINDGSIKRYSSYHSDVLQCIESKYVTIEKSNVIFTDDIVLDAYKVSKGKLKTNIGLMLDELSILKISKQDKIHKQPFQIGF